MTEIEKPDAEYLYAFILRSGPTIQARLRIEPDEVIARLYNIETLPKLDGKNPLVEFVGETDTGDPVSVWVDPKMVMALTVMVYFQRQIARPERIVHGR